MPDYQAADSVIREEGTEDVVNADPRKEWGQKMADTSTPIAPQATVKHGDSPDEDRDARSEQARSY